MPTAVAMVLCYSAAFADVGDQVLFHFDSAFELDSVDARDASVTLADRDGGRALRLATGHAAPWPGITLKAPDGPWDLSRFEYVAVDVTNTANEPVRVSLRVDSMDPAGKRVYQQTSIDLGPRERKVLKLIMKRSLPPALSDKLFGMRGYPGGLGKAKTIDARNIDQLTVFVGRPARDHVFEIDNLRAGGSYDTPEWITRAPEQFFPMIDKYGQFIHGDWPGKTQSDEDLKRQIREEAADLAAHPGPADRNQYGGWRGGPQLAATGHFRAEKHGGKWWLVDPEGRLFWSHGADCVRSTTGYTPLTDREFYFAELPLKDSPLAQFAGRAWWAPHGYYHGKGAFRTYNFTGANLLRKYGPEWKDRFAELCHRRLRSWGLNTIGNWSDSTIYLLRKTPYVATVNSGRKPIEGSSGYWGKFPDVFDPDFQATLTRNLARGKSTTADDPWCIGYFVDNELSWGDELSLAAATLASPPDQPAKRVFIGDLKAKYGAIEKLNEAWATQHASWDALLHSTTPPDKEKARTDLAAFYTKTAKQYFRTCRDAVQQVAPNTLYLGCRFAWVNDRAVHAASQYCDVISFNRYRYTVADLDLPDGVDRPVIIGEFHFGALDRGMFHTGLKPVTNQRERAEAYASYVRGALQNRWIVGTHWFQFGDQATTGRGDGENYQIGLLDICDTPYPETIRACREVGHALYQCRMGE
jgi:hypothetical protein